MNGVSPGRWVVSTAWTLPPWITGRAITARVSPGNAGSSRRMVIARWPVVTTRFRSEPVRIVQRAGGCPEVTYEAGRIVFPKASPAPEEGAEEEEAEDAEKS